MNKTALVILTALTALAGCADTSSSSGTSTEPPAANATSSGDEKQRDPRLDWWRDARFGMFIHWGLYAVPQGEWNGKTNYGEWIRTEAQIPIPEYEKLLTKFNPVKFDAAKIVATAKAAGMKYIVITSKHHDGFALFDSKVSDFDVMATPFHRDIMKELADACHKEGIKICWYHSIMDWHHPDYTPRRDWEKDRPTDKADFNRYVTYMKAQLKELLTNYGDIGVLWFDGQWEGTWTHDRGTDLYKYVRSLQPNIIINNRVDKGGDSLGITRAGYLGDFGTPEQEIPPTGLPNLDWETCMTMNDHWGYNKADQNFKTTKDLIQKLADIASKGGNFLLNVGPTPEGEIPPTSVQRLIEIGDWMKVNGESIHGTQAGPLGLPKWGRSTQKDLHVRSANTRTRLYLHVFNWPANGMLVLDGLYNDVVDAKLLANMGGPRLNTSRQGDNLVIALPPSAPDPNDSVVVLDIMGKPDVAFPPEIKSFADIFVGSAQVTSTTDREGVTLRYTTDGSDPTAKSPALNAAATISGSCTVKVRAFRGEKSVSPVGSRAFKKVECRPGINLFTSKPGLWAEYYEGDWDKLPDFTKMEPKGRTVATAFDRKPRAREDKFAFQYRGYINVPKDGLYRFTTNSDDGSRLWIADQLVVDNDGLHSAAEKSGVIALAAGTHQFTCAMFEKGGGHELQVFLEGPGMERKEVPWSMFVRDPG